MLSWAGEELRKAGRWMTFLIMVVVPALAVMEDRIIEWLRRQRTTPMDDAVPVEAFASAGN